MRLRVTGTTNQNLSRRQIERLFRLGLGSWSGRVRQADVLVEQRIESESGLDFICRIHASLMNWADVSVEGLGADYGAAVQSATRRLVRHIRRHVQSGCFP